jgi:pantoate--beta-alanine ligase
MQVFYTISQIRSELKQYTIAQTIGFVPTMGALHEGHLSLIQFSKQENDITVCSIFVNPTQFNRQEDLLKYPRTLESDLEMLEKAGCDYVFCPSEIEMYPNPLSLGISFRGVGVVVAKLFNIIKPQKAYFGQKDLQQFLIINQLVNQFNFDVILKCCPIVRETDGLAMSSRNRRLSEAQRAIAPKIYEALSLVKSVLIAGEHLQAARATAMQFLNDFKVFEVEYLEIVSAEDLSAISQDLTLQNCKQDLAICIALNLGNIRLIDNVVISYQ